MQSFIITGNAETKRQEVLQKLLAKHDISPFDKTVITKEKTEKRTTDTVGIEDVRILQEKLYLKPIRSKQKAVILTIENDITVEAQNALLKSLEEPPRDTLLILTTPSTKQLLPTILSRCKVLSVEQAATPQADLQKQKEEVEKLLKKSLGERLVLAESLAKDKAQAVAWLELSIQALRQELQETNDLEVIYKTLALFSDTHRTITTTNINLRLALENLFLSLPAHRI